MRSLDSGERRSDRLSALGAPALWARRGLGADADDDPPPWPRRCPLPVRPLSPTAAAVCVNPLRVSEVAERGRRLVAAVPAAKMGRGSSGLAGWAAASRASHPSSCSYARGADSPCGCCHCAEAKDAEDPSGISCVLGV
eukprot:COSAG01_NODE_5301_length_4351_cov_2.957432_5_plen_139_part_00